MTDKKGFVRLNREQKRVLELIKPFDGDGEFFTKAVGGELGAPFDRVIPVMWELHDLGYLTVLGERDGENYVALSSWAYCYRWEYFVHIVLPALVNGLAGVSGGLVVWLLTHLLSPSAP